MYNYNNINYFNLINNQEQFNWQKLFPYHNHFITLIEKENKNYSWICKSCLKSYNNNQSFYYCSLCDYNLCQYCANKYPIIINYGKIPNLNIQNKLITFDLMGNKQEMKFNYGTTVSNALNEYAIKMSLNRDMLQFIYNNSIIMNNESKNIEDYFEGNNIYIVVNYYNYMINDKIYMMKNG